ncbi:MAG: radical SAM protein [Candidatus Thorarchaeota archaeon]
MGYTYGPVASWRYGRSLGIDVTTHPKKCTFNCVYCQLGPTKVQVVTPEDVQETLPSSEEILQEIYRVIRRLDLGTIDAVTFSGAGEPTLNLQIGVLASAVKREVQNLPVILLTNASLLSNKEVRANLVGFDIISAKVDAGDEETFRHINHPAKGIPTLDEIIEGIKKLHKEMYGTLALEVMLLRGPKGFTNAEGQARKALIEKIIDINPDIVQIYTPWRPTAVEDVQPLSKEILQDFGLEISQYLAKEKIWVYGFHDARSNPVKWRRHDRIERDILDLLKRRPCRITDVTVSMGIRAKDAIRVLDNLLSTDRITREKVGDDIFYRMDEIKPKQIRHS